jgi:hypothetical protein
MIKLIQKLDKEFDKIGDDCEKCPVKLICDSVEQYKTDALCDLVSVFANQLKEATNENIK